MRIDRTTEYCDKCDAALFKGKCAKCDKPEKAGKKQKVVYYCQIHDPKLCGMQKDLIRVGDLNGPPIHWCLKHYEERRKKTDIDKEIDRRAKFFADEAKRLGISNYEYFKQYGKGKVNIESLKQIIAKQNPFYANGGK